jgi:hypothetical protein
MPQLIAPDCYRATSPTHGVAHFRTMTLAVLWQLDAGNPLFDVKEPPTGRAPGVPLGQIDGSGVFSIDRRPNARAA